MNSHLQLWLWKKHCVYWALYLHFKMTNIAFKVYMEPITLALLALRSTEILHFHLFHYKNYKRFLNLLRLDPYVRKRDERCTMVNATTINAKTYLQSKCTWRTGSTDGMGRARGWQRFPLFGKCFHYTYRF